MSQVVDIEFRDTDTVVRLEEAGVVLPRKRVAPVGHYSPIAGHTQLLWTSGFGSYDSEGRPIKGIACEPELQEIWTPLVGDLPFLSLDKLTEAGACTARRALTELHLAIGLPNITQIVHVAPTVQGVIGYRDCHLVANGASEVLRTVANTLGWEMAKDPTRMTDVSAGLPTGLAFEMKLLLVVREGTEFHD